MRFVTTGESFNQCRQFQLLLRERAIRDVLTKA
jgi:hypothetical protein